MEESFEELIKMINEKANTESILKTFKESEIKESSKIIEFVEKFVEVKKEETNKLLIFLEVDQFGLNECINILSNFQIFLFVGKLVSYFQKKN